jgi:hypothetical protein
MDRRTRNIHLESLRAFSHLALGHISALRGVPAEKIVLNAKRAVEAIGMEIVIRESEIRGFIKGAAKVGHSPSAIPPAPLPVGLNAETERPMHLDDLPKPGETDFNPHSTPHFPSIELGLPAGDR